MDRHLLEFTRDPGQFLAASEGWLAAEPVIGTVVTTMAHRAVANQAAGLLPAADDWWLVVRDGSARVVGAAMRTAPFGARPLFVLPMPVGAARQLARALHERGESVAAANGALPAVHEVAVETARLRGGEVAVAQHTRLFELGTLVEPRPVPGRLQVVTAGDIDLAHDWIGRFMADADEQAGRAPGSGAHEPPDRAALLRKVAAGVLWFWVDESGEPVHLTGANPPAYGVARIGPVFTPREQRGRGYASAAVAAVSSALVADGVRVCLFTDQANPTSNRIYEALGFRPVVDMANLLIA